MFKKPYLRPLRQLLRAVGPQEDQRQENCPQDDDFLDTMSADMTLGIAAQDHCQSREELVDYAREVELIPYLRFFVERRGWLDDDWNQRLAQTEAEFQQRVN